MAANTKRNLSLLFERPTEPSFNPRGKDNVVFDVPQNYLPDRFRESGPNIGNRFGEPSTHVKVQSITLPDFSFLKQLPRDEPFSTFLPYHCRLASRLIEIFMGMRNVDDLLSAALYSRDNLNPYLFNYAYSVAILHRPDTRDIPLPSLSEIFPEKFVNGKVFSLVRQETNVQEASRVPLEMPRDFTASELEPEQRLAYFREDLGVNLHHWHWHLVYPIDGPRAIVNKDRRGEIFYYMHQQIIARYNLERFSNQLGRVERLMNFRDPIDIGYFPKLDSLISSRVWPPRQRNAVLSDVNRSADQIRFDLADLDRWRERLYTAIHTGVVINANGQLMPLTEMGGIDVLGNLLDSSILSVNKGYYGDLHTMAHMALGYCHDPDNRFLESYGVVAEPATTMRDPVFYRLHAMVDDIFQEHKATLPRYTVQQLDFTGVQVTDVEVNSSPIPAQQPIKNVVPTFWQQSDVDLSRGMDFSPRGPVLVRFTHLQHAPFSYKITIENAGQARTGTVRIFLGPKVDERGLPMLYTDQKNLFIELDKFQVNLKPRTNVIQRRSDESSVSIPFEQTFRNLEDGRPNANTALDALNFCGCGWPDHLLLPKGNEQGMQFQLFVMVSDYAQDRIDQKLEGACADASSYCGIRDKLFPDRRSMGFPFDRQPRNNVDTLTQFLTPNMRVQDIVIRFYDQIQITRKGN